MNARSLLFGLALAAGAAQAQEAATTLFLGVLPGADVTQATATKYGDCLEKIMLKRGALSFIDPATLGSNVNVKENCNSACQAGIARDAGAQHVMSGTLSKNEVGYKASMSITYADTTKKSDVISWVIVGRESALEGDGCLNGGAVIYNYLVTPPTQPHPNWPKGYNFEKARDQALNKGDILKLIAELRAEAEKASLLNGNMDAAQGIEKPTR